MKKRLYETMVVADSAQGEEGFAGTIRHVVERIDRCGGQVERIEKWDERELAYPIEDIKRGVYILIYFYADPGGISELRRLMEISEQITRFAILKNEEEIPPATGPVFNEEGVMIEEPGVEESDDEAEEPDAEEVEDEEAVSAEEEE